MMVDADLAALKAWLADDPGPRHRHRRPGRQLPRRAAARRRASRCTAWCWRPTPGPPTARATSSLHVGDLADVEATRRLVLDLAPDEVYNLAAISSVAQSWEEPDLVTPGQRRWPPVALLEAPAGCRSAGPRGPRRPGLQRRDLRRARPLPAGRGHPGPAAQPVRRGEGLRAPRGRREPAARAARVQPGPLQPRVAAPPGAVRHPQDHLDRGRDRAGPGRPARARQPRRPPRLGLGPRLRRRDGPRRPGRRPGDYVIATGEGHSVGDFVAAAFARGRHRRLASRWCTPTRPSSGRPTPPTSSATPPLARATLGWAPTVGFAEVVARMVAADLDRG